MHSFQKSLQLLMIANRQFFFLFSCTTLHGLSVNMEPHQQQQSRNPRLLFPPEIQPEIAEGKSCLCVWCTVCCAVLCLVLVFLVNSTQRQTGFSQHQFHLSRDRICFFFRIAPNQRKEFEEASLKLGENLECRVLSPTQITSRKISNSNNIKKNFQLK